uniref:Concentrative nucleoside transporter C-terminal domain-containing protein n=1 Tax=Plectus sambesii TaxID=2011161 RepID=A0A914XAR9_9BILA
MGVGSDTTQVLRVAELMGTKTVLNEFIAFQKMGIMAKENLLEPRAQMIATYALCGFSNFSSIGIQLGILGGMAPGKKSILSKIALRALVAGSISCFMTACIAAILVETPFKCLPHSENGQCFDVSYYQALMANYTTVASTTAAPTTMSNF